jgi:GNAT superfamily N-acetyltransferase
MTITVIDESSPYLKQVINLADANSATLGFLPEEGFIEGARRGTLLVALDDVGKFMGYLLYGISGKKMLAYIVHLCILPEYRKRGVASALVRQLKAVTGNTLRGIRVHCRRDYEANQVWPSLGFVARGEIRGRAKKETILTVWWLDFGHPTLFSIIDDLQEHSKLKVSMDANVFYKLTEPATREREECKALLADWLTETIELCVTDELFNEIDRNPDRAVRVANRNFASKFRLVSGTENKFWETQESLRSLFYKRLTVSDKSDIRQLARSVSAGIQFFVTLDPRLLRKTDEIFEAVGIRVLRPAEMIVGQDALLRETEYQPVRLAGASMGIERARPMEQALINESFRAPQDETKQQFTALLNSLLAAPHAAEVKVVKDADRPRALLAFNRAQQGELEVSVLRIDRDLSAGLGATLMRYLLQELILTSAKEDRVITRITDPYLTADFVDALIESGFSFFNGAWIKFNLAGVMTAEETLLRLSWLGSQFPWTKEYAQHLIAIIDSAVANRKSDRLLSAEKALWPVKLREVNLPAFIVPIWPEWAMHLFDPGIGSQDLFGGNPNLIFRVENAYYRTCTPRVVCAPARILWYVSKHTGKYQGTEAIKACSYLDDLVIDKPKILFTRFRRLGVFRWKDVFNLAKRDREKEIMGFRFTNTEVLARPIDKKTLQMIWRERWNKNFHIQCPIKIPEEMFYDLYSIGLH